MIAGDGSGVRFDEILRSSGRLDGTIERGRVFALAEPTSIPRGLTNGSARGTICHIGFICARMDTCGQYGVLTEQVKVDDVEQGVSGD